MCFKPKLTESESKFEEGILKSIFIELKLGDINIICGALYRSSNESNSAIDAFFSILRGDTQQVKKEK